MSTIVFFGLKGGTAKTSSAMHALMGLSTFGETLLIDADPQGTALDWCERAEMPNCVALPTRDLRKRVPDQFKRWGVEHVIIDTPPGDIAIVRGALGAADLAVIPLPPTAIDFNRLQASLDLADEHPDLPTYILLTRVDRRTRSSDDARLILSELTAEGKSVPVLDSEVPMLLDLANAFGRPIPDDLGEYAPVIKELIGKLP